MWGGLPHFQAGDFPSDRGGELRAIDPLTHGDLPAIVTATILEMAGHQLTSREIGAQLQEERGIAISHGTVARYLRGVRDARADDSGAVAQQYLRSSLPTDLELLAEVRDQLDAWRKDEKLRISERLMVIRTLNTIISTRLRFSGLGEPTEHCDLSSLSDAEVDAIISGKSQAFYNA
jgi:hypothetical protein